MARLLSGSLKNRLCKGTTVRRQVLAHHFIKHLQIKQAVVFAGSYALLAASVLYINFKMNESETWGVIAFLITLPWSIAVSLAGFLLIHIFSDGIKYGYVISVLANTALIYLVGRSLERSTKSGSR